MLNMARHLRAAALGLVFTASLWGQAFAQNSFPTPGGATVPGYVTMCVVANLAVPCNSGSVVAGTTPVTGCANTQVLFNNNGVVGCDAGLTHVAGAFGAVNVPGALSAGTLAVAGGLTQINAGGQVVMTAISTRGAANTMTGTCTSGTQVGGTWAGRVTVTCTAGQTLIIAITTGGANGQACYINDLTTPATVINQTATGGNSATWTFPAGSGASDVLQWHCISY